jgi:PleD family two-component response regulator
MFIDLFVQKFPVASFHFWNSFGKFIRNSTNPTHGQTQNRGLAFRFLVFTIFNDIITPHTCHAKHRVLSARIVRDFDLGSSAYEKMLIVAINEMNQVNIRHAEKLPPIVFVIDDDASMRAALSSLIRSIGLRVEVFASAPDFLATKAKRIDGASCLILDVRLPGVSGLDFQAELAKTNSVIPITLSPVMVISPCPSKR